MTYDSLDWFQKKYRACVAFISLSIVGVFGLDKSSQRDSKVREIQEVLEYMLNTLFSHNLGPSTLTLHTESWNICKNAGIRIYWPGPLQHTRHRERNWSCKLQKYAKTTENS